MGRGRRRRLLLVTLSRRRPSPPDNAGLSDVPQIHLRWRCSRCRCARIGAARAESAADHLHLIRRQMVRVAGCAPPALRGVPLRPPALAVAGRAPRALGWRHVRLCPARGLLQMARMRFAHLRSPEQSGAARFAGRSAETGGIPGATRAGARRGVG